MKDDAASNQVFAISDTLRRIHKDANFMKDRKLPVSFVRRQPLLPPEEQEKQEKPPEPEIRVGRVALLISKSAAGQGK